MAKSKDRDEALFSGSEQVRQAFQEDISVFQNAMLRHISESNLSRLDKWRYSRRIKRKAFAERVRNDFIEDLFWENPDTFSGLIDWENLDIDKLAALFEIIKSMIQFISDLFVSILMLLLCSPIAAMALLVLCLPFFAA